MKVIETAWKDYAEKALPPAVSRVQLLETQKAFYAGAGCLLDGILKVLGPGVEPTESDLLIMDGIQAELQEFVRGVSEKRVEDSSSGDLTRGTKSPSRKLEIRDTEKRVCTCTSAPAAFSVNGCCPVCKLPVIEKKVEECKHKYNTIESNPKECLLCGKKV